MKTLLKTLAYAFGGAMFLTGLLTLAKTPELMAIGVVFIVIGATICVLVPR